MKAMELPGPGAPLRLVQRDVPMPGPGEVRVRIQACGVCGSDLFLQDGGFSLDTSGAHALERFPVVPGHEAAGVVDLVGEGVTGLELGRQVAIYYLDPAPDGDWAKRGLANLDPAARRMGVDIDGAFAEFVVRPAHTLIPTLGAHESRGAGRPDGCGSNPVSRAHDPRPSAAGRNARCVGCRGTRLERRSARPASGRARHSGQPQRGETGSRSLARRPRDGVGRRRNA